MTDTVYVERAIHNKALTQEILSRAQADTVIEIERYGEVFNPKAQNFRLQKLNPALIVAEKHGNFVLPTPTGYGIGSENNYYFSHMMNCIYDCRYCFLQGMYQSANYVLFANYEDFFNEISRTSNIHKDEPVWFFSGYDCDSLALEPVTHFMAHCLDFFCNQDNHGGNNLQAAGRSVEKSDGKSKAPVNAFLEIRTKSTQIRNLLKRQPSDNCVIAYSLSPQPIAEAIEHKTPSLEKRINALRKLQQHGWPIGLRFDPLIAAENFEELYSDMFDQVFNTLDMKRVHSISLGTFRLPKPFFKKVIKLYPEEPMFAVDLEQTDQPGTNSSKQAMIGYPSALEQSMMDYCTSRILSVTDQSRFFPCHV